jgi:hypothetical protein
VDAGRAGGSGRLYVLVAILVALLLVLISAADLDGDPTTSNIPDAVLVAPGSVPAEAIMCSDDSDREPRLSARMGSRVKQFTGRAERWTRLLRRFHRSIITDIPI